MDRPPCYSCVPPERYIGCHPNCEKYLAWKKDRIDICHIINQKKREESINVISAVRRKDARRKRARRKG